MLKRRNDTADVSSRLLSLPGTALQQAGRKTYSRHVPLITYPDGQSRVGEMIHCRHSPVEAEQGFGVLLGHRVRGLLAGNTHCSQAS